MLRLPECVRCEAAGSRNNASFRDPDSESLHCHQWDLEVTSSYLLEPISLSIQLSSVQSLSRVQLFATPWTPYQLNGVNVPAVRSLT